MERGRDDPYHWEGEGPPLRSAQSYSRRATSPFKWPKGKMTSSGGAVGTGRVDRPLAAGRILKEEVDAQSLKKIGRRAASLSGRRGRKRTPPSEDKAMQETNLIVTGQNYKADVC